MLVYAFVRTCFFSIRQCQQAGIPSIPCIIYMWSYVQLFFVEFCLLWRIKFTLKCKIWLHILRQSGDCLLDVWIENFLVLDSLIQLQCNDNQVNLSNKVAGGCQLQNEPKLKFENCLVFHNTSSEREMQRSEKSERKKCWRKKKCVPPWPSYA